MKIGCLALLVMFLFFGGALFLGPGFAETESDHWPWFRGIDSFYLVMLFPLLLLPFILALGRSFVRPGFGYEGLGYQGFRPQYFFVALTLGLIFSFWGVFGHAAHPERAGFLPFFAKDLYTLPLFFVVTLGGVFGQDFSSFFGIAPMFIVFLFWLLLCGGVGLLVGRWRAPTLFSLPMLLAILPFLMITRGCAGPEAYAFESTYEPMALYPGAFSSLLLIPLIFVFLLGFVSPYHGYGVQETSGGLLRAPGFGGCAFPICGMILGLLFAALGIWVFPMVTSGFFLYPILAIFSKLPLMMDFPFLPPMLAILLFWVLLGGVFGLGMSRLSFMNPVLPAMIPALIGLIFLVSSFGPGQDRLLVSERVFYARERALQALGLPTVIPDGAEGEREVIGAEGEAELPTSDFGDGIGAQDAFSALDQLGRELIEGGVDGELVESYNDSGSSSYWSS